MPVTDTRSSRSSGPSFQTLWRVVMVNPSGLPQTFELRAPSEQIALDRLAQYKPDWRVHQISRRPT